MGLSQALNAAVSGLRTAQAGLSLVSANVANAETPGYVKKVLNQQTTSAGGAGVSVRVVGVDRIVNEYVQKQLRTETSGGAYASLMAQFYQRLQGIYGDPGAANSIETVFNNFANSLQALTTNPADYSARSGVLNSAQVLTQQLNSLSGDIQTLRSDAEFALGDAVKTANDTLQRLAEINLQLSATQGSDASRATLLDQRDAALDQLAKLMDIKVSEGDYNQVNVFSSSGIQLVGLRAARLTFDAQGTITPSGIWDPDPNKRSVGTISMISPTGSVLDLIDTKSIRGGQIAALIEMRDHVLTQAQAQLDELAAAMSQALSDRIDTGTPVTAGSQAGFDVDVGALLAGNTVKIRFTDNLTNQVKTLTLVRVDDPTALPLTGAATADANDQVIGLDWSLGLPALVNQLNAQFNGKISFANPGGTTLEILNNVGGNPTTINLVAATATITGLSGSATQLPFFTDATRPYTGEIVGTGSQLTGYAARISVNPALLANPTKLVDYLAAGTPAGDPTRPRFLYDQLIGTTRTFSPATGIGSATAPLTGSIETFVRQFLAQQGDAAQSADRLAQGQDLVVGALQQRFNSASSVNIDEEMANLLTLQTAYGANARVMTVIRDVMNMLLQS